MEDRPETPDLPTLTRKAYLTWNEVDGLLFYNAFKRISHGNYKKRESLKNARKSVRDLFEDAFLNGELKGESSTRGNIPIYRKIKKGEMCAWFMGKRILDLLKDKGIEVPAENVKFIEEAAKEKPEPEPQAEPPQDAPGNVFILDGDFWRITFNGESLPPVKGYGMGYIHELISGPADGISCGDLYAPKLSGDKNPFVEKPEPNDTIGMSAKEESMDQPGIDAVRKEKEELEEELEDLLLHGANSKEDQTRERALKAEIDKYVEYLNEVTNKKGKPKVTLPNNQKNIQNNVCNAITRAIKEIKSHSIGAGTHFENVIDKGWICLYKDHSIEWHT